MNKTLSLDIHIRLARSESIQTTTIRAIDAPKYSPVGDKSKGGTIVTHTYSATIKNNDISKISPYKGHMLICTIPTSEDPLIIGSDRFPAGISIRGNDINTSIITITASEIA